MDSPYTFYWSHAGASFVFITGTFNNWNKTAMLRASDGTFHITIDLPLGMHDYKFIVDNKWRYDITKSIVKDERGNINNCVHLDGLSEALLCSSSPEEQEKFLEGSEEAVYTSGSESESDGNPKSKGLRSKVTFNNGSLSKSGEKKKDGSLSRSGKYPIVKLKEPQVAKSANKNVGRVMTKPINQPKGNKGF